MSDAGAEAAGHPAEPVLVCTDVTKCFDGRNGGVRVLRGVNLCVSPGDIVVIVGKTGAGKSTLLHILAGLERPTSGSVTVDGRPLEGLSKGALARLRREKIGIIFQSFNLLPSWTAVENVEAAMLHTGMARAARRERAEALLGQLGLAHRLRNLPAELSAGQQQLVAIARTLANRPALILADEPTGDVDPETAQAIVGRFAALTRQRGVALIVATHGPFPLAVATRLLRVEDGRLVPDRAHDPAASHGAQEQQQEA